MPKIELRQQVQGQRVFSSGGMRIGQAIGNIAPVAAQINKNKVDAENFRIQEEGRRLGNDAVRDMIIKSADREQAEIDIRADSNPEDYLTELAAWEDDYNEKQFSDKAPVYVEKFNQSDRGQRLRGLSSMGTAMRTDRLNNARSSFDTSMNGAISNELAGVVRDDALEGGVMKESFIHDRYDKQVMANNKRDVRAMVPVERLEFLNNHPEDESLAGLDIRSLKNEALSDINLKHSMDTVKGQLEDNSVKLSVADAGSLVNAQSVVDGLPEGSRARETAIKETKRLYGEVDDPTTQFTTEQKRANAVVMVDAIKNEIKSFNDLVLTQKEGTDKEVKFDITDPKSLEVFKNRGAKLATRIDQLFEQRGKEITETVFRQQLALVTSALRLGETDLDRIEEMNNLKKMSNMMNRPITLPMGMSNLFPTFEDKVIQSPASNILGTLNFTGIPGKGQMFKTPEEELMYNSYIVDQLFDGNQSGDPFEVIDDDEVLSDRREEYIKGGLEFVAKNKYGMTNKESIDNFVHERSVKQNIDAENTARVVATVNAFIADVNSDGASLTIEQARVQMGKAPGLTDDAKEFHAQRIARETSR